MFVKLVDLSELELSLKTEKSPWIKKLHEFIFGSASDRNNCERYCELMGFPFKTKSHEYEGKIIQIKNDFSINVLITICNVLYIGNLVSLDNLNCQNNFLLM